MWLAWIALLCPVLAPAFADHAQSAATSPDEKRPCDLAVPWKVDHSADADMQEAPIAPAEFHF